MEGSRLPGPLGPDPLLPEPGFGAPAAGPNFATRAPVRSPLDWTLEAISLTGVLALFAILWANWSELAPGLGQAARFGPRESQRFFDLSGIWTVRNALLTVTGLNALVYLGLTVAGQKQRLIQIPAEIDRRSPHLRQMVFRIAIVLKALLMVFAVYLAWRLMGIGARRPGFLSGFLSGFASWEMQTLALFALVVPVAFYAARVWRQGR